jgi:dTDP-4-amino-4,6-dideoxygalactose transaminase
MPYLDEILAKRKENFMEIAKVVYKKSKIFYPVRYDHIDFLSNFAVPLICKTKRIRDELVEKCRDILEIRPIVGGDMIVQPFFKKYVNGFTGENRNAKTIHEQGLYFGNNPEMTRKDMIQIFNIFSEINE